jgi:hypothetical protein
MIGWNVVVCYLFMNYNCDYSGGIQSKTWCMGSYAGVDYNLTLCPLQSRLEHIYHGRQLYTKVDLNPMPESTLSPSQGLWIWPLVALIAIYRQL